MVRFIFAAVVVMAALPAIAQPAALAGREWRVIRIAGAPVPAGAPVTIAFLSDGRVAGRSGCNRFSGRVDAEGQRMTFGPLASTRMACPPPLMAVETRFLDALRLADRWRLDRGVLVLAGPDGRAIRARRAPPQR